MTILIFVKNLKTAKHKINKYVILTMYSHNAKNHALAIVAIIYKVHLITELKLNLLIDNNVLKSEMIDISNSTEIIYIEGCEIIIFIIIKIKIKSHFKSIHTFEISIISFKSEYLISIHNISSLSNKKFLFQSLKTTNFFIYAHILDSNTSFILIRNEQNQIIKTSRNFPLKSITKFDYFNAY